MAFKFPFTNYHELNLTWVLDKLKELFEESAENVSVIQNYDGRLTAVETELPTVSETASEASRAAAAAGTLAQTAKATADTAQENAIQAQRSAGTAQNTAERAQEAADAATQAAQQAQATAQNFDGRITQAENDASQALEASRSFENRVQSAITTANNAAQTATNAQGIAMRADQNAGAALDKIGDLSQLTTTAKNNLVVAINEAAQSGGVTSVNSKTGAVVLDAGDIGYNGTTVETALDGKQNAPTAAGTAGQVLGLNNSLQPVWVDQTGGGGDTSNCAPLIINTASGNIASFSDGADNRQIRKIVATIEPVQSGSGDPSPDNVRPISGWTGANIYNEETYDASAIPKLTINWQSSAGTIYGGTVTLNEDGSADLVADMAKVVCDAATRVHSTLSVGTTCSGDNFTLPAKAKPGSGNYTPSGAICSISNTERGAYYNTAEKNDGFFNNYPNISALYSVSTTGGSFYVFIRGTDYTSESYNDAIAGCEICYYLATPITYHFPNIGQLLTFFGENNVWIDTGAITECDYPADTKLYIDNKIAELQALVLEQ